MRARTHPRAPTHFEAVTAAAFLHFARAARSTWRVLEVGLGGRLDATNVSEPVASAIVTIARDHEAQLGREPRRHRAREGGRAAPRARHACWARCRAGARGAIGAPRGRREPACGTRCGEGGVRERADGLRGPHADADLSRAAPAARRAPGREPARGARAAGGSARGGPPRRLCARAARGRAHALGRAPADGARPAGGAAGRRAQPGGRARAGAPPARTGGRSCWCSAPWPTRTSPAMARPAVPARAVGGADARRAGPRGRRRAPWRGAPAPARRGAHHEPTPAARWPGRGRWRAPTGGWWWRAACSWSARSWAC